MKLRTVEIFENELRATISQHILEKEGIKARIFKNFTLRFRFVHDFKEIGFELQVFEVDFEKAYSILQLKENQLKENSIFG